MHQLTGHDPLNNPIGNPQRSRRRAAKSVAIRPMRLDRDSDNALKTTMNILDGPLDSSDRISAAMVMRRALIVYLQVLHANLDRVECEKISVRASTNMPKRRSV